jgi:hypothetical protein
MGGVGDTHHGYHRACGTMMGIASLHLSYERRTRQVPSCSHVFVIGWRLAERSLQDVVLSSQCEKPEICVARGVAHANA